MTTDDCKKFLFKLCPTVPEKAWKRTRKIKDANGDWLRTFEALGQTVILAEHDNTL